MPSKTTSKLALKKLDERDFSVDAANGKFINLYTAWRNERASKKYPDSKDQFAHAIRTVQSSLRALVSKVDKERYDRYFFTSSGFLKMDCFVMGDGTKEFPYEVQVNLYVLHDGQA